MSVCGYTVSMLYSFAKGAPYISTKDKVIDEVLKLAQLKPGMVFLELGCGDGRLVKKAVEKYQVKGKGIDINQTLILLAKIRSKIAKMNDIEFVGESVFVTDLSQADVIYLFLLPGLISKLEKRFITDTKKPVLIISHGFKIPVLKPYLSRILEGHYKTYYYDLQKGA